MIEGIVDPIVKVWFTHGFGIVPKIKQPIWFQSLKAFSESPSPPLRNVCVEDGDSENALSDICRYLIFIY